MTKISIEVPDEKYPFFIELMNNLGFNLDQDISIPEAQKELVRKRIQLSQKEPSRILDWDDVKDSFDLDA